MDLLKRFFKFVIPSIVSMWVFSLYSMVDGMYVSHGVGESALAAVNLSMPYTAVIFTVGLL
ncbi:MAG: MATE family efflux transporter, partial [Oscillospiraceae bacterium]